MSSLMLPRNAKTGLMIAGHRYTLEKAIAERGGPVTIDTALGGMPVDIPVDVENFRVERVGVLTLRFGERGKPGWSEATVYVAPESVDTAPAYGGRGRQILGALLADVPLERLDLEHVTDAHPWPLVLRDDGREWESPGFRRYGGA